MTNEYEWIDSRDECKREYGSADMALGWIIYAAALIFIIV